MSGPYKGFLTQHTTQQQYTKPRHQPSDRDQRARDRLRNKISAFQAKIKSPAQEAATPSCEGESQDRRPQSHY